jgi:SAM-dependent methyltransferase
MAHKEQQQFCKVVKGLFPRYFFNKRILDVGSMDICGSNRELFWFCNYTGLDIGKGKNVDIICPVRYLTGVPAYFDTVISTEVWEHDRDYMDSIANCIRLLKPGGLFFFTCATTGRPEHGTKRTTAYASPYTIDYYKNVTEEMIRAIPGFNDAWNLCHFDIQPTSHDLRFIGIKKGSDLKFNPSLIVCIIQHFLSFFNLRLMDLKNFLKTHKL